MTSLCSLASRCLWLLPLVLCLLVSWAIFVSDTRCGVPVIAPSVRDGRSMPQDGQLELYCQGSWD